MTVNLLQHAPGEHAALFLDDVLPTIDRERTAVRDLGVTDAADEDAVDYVYRLNEWMDDHAYRDETERAEHKCVLVIDLYMPTLPPISRIREAAEIDEPLPPQVRLDYDDGWRAGIVFLEYVLRSSKRYRHLPAIILTAYEVGAAEQRFKRIRKATDVPTAYLCKTVADGPVDDAPGRFAGAVCDVLYDPHLVFMNRLAQFWSLSEEQVCRMLGLRETKIELAAQLFDRGNRFITDDPAERARNLYFIRKCLSNLFRDRTVELDWLNDRKAFSEGSPLELLCSGSHGSIAHVKSEVASLSGL